MVLTPFTWRYGGKQVFLYGSFNGWSERLPMEGSASFFQRILDLPPGCYQYKFLVDGTWQVDQQHICEADECGSVNNIVLVNGAELISPDLNYNALQPSTSGANVRFMLPEGSSSSGPLNQPFMQLSEGEMDVFRQVLSRHLLSSTTYELIPDSTKIAALDVEVDVEQAFHVMYELGVSLVALWDDGRKQVAGMLTASDFILILLQLHGNRQMLANQDLEIRTISAWKGWKVQHWGDITGNLVPFHRQPLIHVGPDDSLGDVASMILQSNICAIPIIQSENGSCPRLLHIACLAGILRNVCRHFKHHLGYLPVLQQPVGYLPIGTWNSAGRRASGRPLLTFHPDDPLSSVLTLLMEAKISSVPIVDYRGNIINIFSRSDITLLAKDNIYNRVQLNQMTISQALEVGVGGRAGRDRYKTCTRFDSLFRVMELLSEPDVRRVIVVETSSNHLEGIITLRDVFAFFSR